MVGPATVFSEKETFGKVQPSSRESSGSMSAKKVRAEEKKAPRKVEGDSGRNGGQPPPSPAAAELRQSGGVELRGSVRRLLPGHLSELLLFLREPERLLSLRCLVSAGAAQTAGRSVAAARSASPRPAPARRSAARRQAAQTEGEALQGEAEARPRRRRPG